MDTLGIQYPEGVQPLARLLVDRRSVTLGELSVPETDDIFVNKGVINFTKPPYNGYVPRDMIPDDIWRFMGGEFECLYGPDSSGSPQCNPPPFVPVPEAKTKDEEIGTDEKPTNEAVGTGTDEKSTNEDILLKINEAREKLRIALDESKESQQKLKKAKDEFKKEKAELEEARRQGELQAIIEANARVTAAERAKDEAERAKNEAEARVVAAESAKQEAEARAIAAEDRAAAAPALASDTSSAPNLLAAAPATSSADVATKEDIEALRKRIDELMESRQSVLPSLPSLAPTFTDLMKPKEKPRNRIPIRDVEFTVLRRKMTKGEYESQMKTKIHNLTGFLYVWPYDDTTNKHSSIEDTQPIEIVFLEPLKGDKRSAVEKMKEFILQDYTRYRQGTNIQENNDKKTMTKQPYKGTLRLNETTTLVANNLSKYFTDLASHIPGIVSVDDLESIKDFAVYIRLLSAEMYTTLTEYLKQPTGEFDFQHVYYVLPSSIYPDTIPGTGDIQLLESDYFNEKSQDVTKYPGIVKIQSNPADLMEMSDEAMTRVVKVGSEGGIEALGGAEKPLQTFAYSYMVADVGGSVGVNTTMSLPYTIFTMGDVLKIPYFVSRGSIDRLDKQIGSLEEEILKMEEGEDVNTPFFAEKTIGTDDNQSKITMDVSDMKPLLMDRIFRNFQLYRTLLTAPQNDETDKTIQYLATQIQIALEKLDSKKLYTFDVHGTTAVTAKKSSIIDNFTAKFVDFLEKLRSIFRFGQLVTVRGQRIRKIPANDTLHTDITDIVDKMDNTIQKLTLPASDTKHTNKEQQLETYSKSPLDFITITFTKFKSPTAESSTRTPVSPPQPPPRTNRSTQRTD